MGVYKVIHRHLGCMFFELYVNKKLKPSVDILSILILHYNIIRFISLHKIITYLSFWQKFFCAICNAWWSRWNSKWCTWHRKTSVKNPGK